MGQVRYVRVKSGQAQYNYTTRLKNPGHFSSMPQIESTFKPGGLKN